MIKFKECPWCGIQPEFDHYGTCMNLKCPECDAGPDIQISDMMTMDERMAMTFDVGKDGFGYPEFIINRIERELVLRWQDRAKKWWQIWK